jgi:hypothetical protein
LFLFSDKKLVAYPGNVLGQSIYKYKRLYYLPFPNVTVTWGPMRPAMLLNVIPWWRSPPTSHSFLR